MTKTTAVAPARTASPARVATAAPAAAPAPVPIAEPTPIVDTTPAPAVAPAAPVAASPPVIDTDQALMFGAGALALIALAAAAVALARRKRRRHELAEYDMAPEMAEPVAAPEPAPAPVFEPQPTIIAPPRSAFAWNMPPRTTAATPSNETWVERAQRGPTPDNPSLSLRKRMKRAAFFDQREADAAAGKAVAVDPDAGLPDNLDTRELEAA